MTSSVILQGQMRDFQCSGHIVTCRAPARAPLCTAAKSVGNWALPTLHCTEAPLSLHCRERYRRVYDALDLAGLLKVIRDLNMMYYWESWWHRNAVNACQPWVVAVTLLMHWMLNIFQGLNQFENRISFKNWNEVIGAVPFIRVKNQLVAPKRAPVVQWSIEHCIQGGVGVIVEHCCPRPPALSGAQELAPPARNILNQLPLQPSNMGKLTTSDLEPPTRIC